MLLKQDASHFSLTRKKGFLIKWSLKMLAFSEKQEVDNVIY